MFHSDGPGGAAGDEQSCVVPQVARQVAEVRGLLDHLLADLAASGAPVVSHDPAVPDDRLRELLARLEHARNALEAAQADAMVAMGREAQARDLAEASDGSWRSHEEFVPDELSVLLSCTRVAASGRYATAWEAQRHPQLSAAWRRGTIDRQKVQLIAEGLASLDRVGAANLVEDAVKYASHRTGAQLRQWLRRRVISADPAAAERRRSRAMADRRVVITPDADGMSTLWAWLPSVQARQVQEVLTSMAHELGGGPPTNDASTCSSICCWAARHRRPWRFSWWCPRQRWQAGPPSRPCCRGWDRSPLDN